MSVLVIEKINNFLKNFIYLEKIKYFKLNRSNFYNILINDFYISPIYINGKDSFLIFYDKLIYIVYRKKLLYNIRFKKYGDIIVKKFDINISNKNLHLGTIFGGYYFEKEDKFIIYDIYRFCDNDFNNINIQTKLKVFKEYQIKNKLEITEYHKINNVDKLIKNEKSIGIIFQPYLSNNKYIIYNKNIFIILRYINNIYYYTCNKKYIEINNIINKDNILLFNNCYIKTYFFKNNFYIVSVSKNKIENIYSYIFRDFQ